MSKKTLAKPFTIAGFLAGEAYMLYMALAPNLKGTVVPWDAVVKRCLALAVFFGPFGAALGLGLWLLGVAILQSFRGTALPPEADTHPAPPAKTTRP